MSVVSGSSSHVMTGTGNIGPAAYAPKERLLARSERAWQRDSRCEAPSRFLKAAAHSLNLPLLSKMTSAKATSAVRFVCHFQGSFLPFSPMSEESLVERGSQNLSIPGPRSQNDLPPPTESKKRNLQRETLVPSTPTVDMEMLEMEKLAKRYLP